MRDPSTSRAQEEFRVHWASKTTHAQAREPGEKTHTHTHTNKFARLAYWPQVRRIRQCDHHRHIETSIDSTTHVTALWRSRPLSAASLC